MANGFRNPKPGEPGYMGPVPGALGGMVEAGSKAVDAVATGWNRTGGAAVSAGQAGVENAASGLRDVGHSLFGPQTAIGGLFGGGNEQSASPDVIPAARPTQAPMSQSTISTPTATARPLVTAPTTGPSTSSMTGGKQKAGKRAKRKKKGK